MVAVETISWLEREESSSSRCYLIHSAHLTLGFLFVDILKNYQYYGFSFESWHNLLSIFGIKAFHPKVGTSAKEATQVQIKHWEEKLKMLDTTLLMGKKGIFEGLLAGLNLLGNKMLIQIAWLDLVQTAQLYHIMIFPKSDRFATSGSLKSLFISEISPSGFL